MEFKKNKIDYNKLCDKLLKYKYDTIINISQNKFTYL